MCVTYTNRSASYRTQHPRILVLVVRGLGPTPLMPQEQQHFVLAYEDNLPEAKKRGFISGPLDSCEKLIEGVVCSQKL